MLPNLRAVRRLHEQLERLLPAGPRQPRGAAARQGARLRPPARVRARRRLRDVAWNASARHGKLIVREYRLDRSPGRADLPRPRPPHGRARGAHHPARPRRQRRRAARLHLQPHGGQGRHPLLRRRGRTGLAHGRGTAHLREITAFAAGVEAEYRHTDYLALAADLRRRLRSRALVLILTVLPELEGEGELLRAVETARAAAPAAVVVLTDPDLAAAASFLPDDKPSSAAPWWRATSGWSAGACWRAAAARRAGGRDRAGRRGRRGGEPLHRGQAEAAAVSRRKFHGRRALHRGTAGPLAAAGRAARPGGALPERELGPEGMRELLQPLPADLLGSEPGALATPPTRSSWGGSTTSPAAAIASSIGAARGGGLRGSLARFLSSRFPAAFRGSGAVAIAAAAFLLGALFGAIAVLGPSGAWPRT